MRVFLTVDSQYLPVPASVVVAVPQLPEEHRVDQKFAGSPEPRFLHDNAPRKCLTSA